MPSDLPVPARPLPSAAGRQAAAEHRQTAGGLGAGRLILDVANHSWTNGATVQLRSKLNGWNRGRAQLPLGGRAIDRA